MNWNLIDFQPEVSFRSAEGFRFLGDSRWLLRKCVSKLQIVVQNAPSHRDSAVRDVGFGN